VSEPQQQIVPHIIIPCAGEGNRFKDAGYTEDKPLIRVGGRRLIDWVLDCIPKSWYSNLVFIVRYDQSRLIDELSDLIDVNMQKVIPLVGPTQGAACSVLAAAVGLPPDEPVLVMNSDQWFKIGSIEDSYPAIGDMRSLHIYALRTRLDGFILTFPGTGPAWSYAVTNGAADANRVIHVIEKKQVSPYATVGAYWWRRAGDLVRSVCAMIAVGEKTNDEFYLAPSLNFMPLSDKNVQIIPVQEFHGLGTPEQVRAFEQHLATQQPELAEICA